MRINVYVWWTQSMVPKHQKWPKMNKIILRSSNGGANNLWFHFYDQVFPYPPPKSLKLGYSDLNPGLSDPKVDFSDLSDPKSRLLDPKSNPSDPKSGIWDTKSDFSDFQVRPLRPKIRPLEPQIRHLKPQIRPQIWDNKVLICQRRVKVIESRIHRLL